MNVRTWSAFRDADKWARTNAREEMHPFHFWRVERLSNARDAEFAVAIRSRNDGALHHYAGS